jgi:hypothetical protein
MRVFVKLYVKMMALQITLLRLSIYKSYTLKYANTSTVLTTEMGVTIHISVLKMCVTRCPLDFESLVTVIYVLN